jgi:hypothetical protein
VPPSPPQERETLDAPRTPHTYTYIADAIVDITVEWMGAQHTHKSAVLFKQPPHTHRERKRRETNRVAAAQPTDRKEMR